MTVIIEKNRKKTNICLPVNTGKTTKTNQNEKQQ